MGIVQVKYEICMLGRGVTVQNGAVPFSAGVGERYQGLVPNSSNLCVCRHHVILYVTQILNLPLRQLHHHSRFCTSPLLRIKLAVLIASITSKSREAGSIIVTYALHGTHRESEVVVLGLSESYRVVFSTI
jgi:hypothetical protein